MTEPELRERVELVLRAARSRFMQNGEDNRNTIITALEGMKWALELDPEGTPEEMRQILERVGKARMSAYMHLQGVGKAPGGSQ